MDHLQEEVRLLKTENVILRSKQNEDSNINRLQTSSHKSSIGPSSVEENDRLLLLTKKLQDVQKLYDKVKQDISKYKQVFMLICVCVCILDFLESIYYWCIIKVCTMTKSTQDTSSSLCMTPDGTGRRCC